MKIDFEGLFYIVHDHFGEIFLYHRFRLKCWENLYGDIRICGVTPKNKPLNVDSLGNEDACTFAKFYERRRYGDNIIENFCNVFSIDPRKLYGLVKSVRKWYEKRKWHGSFPFDKNHDRIYKYLRKE